jgi:23S rRNA (pseudouridine1915-N3)-methyltransferase
MQTVTIICEGKLKESYLRDACAEYSKRLSAYCKLNIVELNPHRISENPSENEIASVLEAESKEILSKIPNGAKVYAMCIEGKQMSSEKLSKSLSDCAVNGYNNVVFIIGGSHGLSNSVKSRADFRLSMSEMTFPHQLARVMLLEQIYRAYQISTGGKYHK